MQERSERQPLAPYAVDRDFGPFFLRFCSYFRYNAKLCLNGHEWLKRQLEIREIGYEALDNGILSCARSRSGRRPVSLPRGLAVHGAGDQEEYLYFLTAGIVARFYVMANGASAEYAVTGSEGVIGVASFLGGESTPSQAVVLTTGYAYRLESELAKSDFEHDGPLLHLLLRYIQALIAETGRPLCATATIRWNSNCAAGSCHAWTGCTRTS